jgi:hypothetical protein
VWLEARAARGPYLEAHDRDAAEANLATVFTSLRARGGAEELMRTFTAYRSNEVAFARTLAPPSQRDQADADAHAAAATNALTMLAAR